MYELTRNPRKNAIKHFIDEYKAHFGDSVDKLYNGIMRNQRFSDNIVGAIKKKTKCYKRKVEVFTLGLTQLVLQGIKVKLSYFALLGWRRRCYEAQERWKAKLQNMKNFFQKVSNECRNNYHTLMTNDVTDLINKNNGANNNVMMKKIYDFVMTKYNWRVWSVVVYDDIVGFDNHAILTCGGKAWLHKNGKNIIVSSQDEHNSARYNMNSANKFLKDTEDNVKQCRIIAKKSENRAKILLYNMRDRSNACFPLALKMVVTTKRKLSWISPLNHLASRSITNWKTCCWKNDGWWGGRKCRRIRWQYRLVVAW